MANGYAGKILKIDLTDRSIEEIPTEKYKDWGGGHGMGSAVFWDLCEDKSVPGTDPKNVITLMTSPMSGTLAPAVAGRTEVQAIGIQAYPIGWYTRSNFGGRFSTQLKFAGWDGIAVLGKADSQVWINVVNGKVTIEDATDLWGLSTYETQEEIWASVLDAQGAWNEMTRSRDGGRTTQRPAVVTTGPNAETFGPMAALVHDAGNGAGQGGFGGVLASKNVKAISVLGTGGVEIADPNALMEARMWANTYAYAGNTDKVHNHVGIVAFGSNPSTAITPITDMPAGMKSRPQGCVACIRNCRTRTETGEGNESSCVDVFWYNAHDRGAHGNVTGATVKAADVVQKAGLNSFALEATMLWLENLRELDLIGEGKEIESSLPFDEWGTAAFAQALGDSIVNQTDIGADLALGLGACAEKWGRLEEDTTSGILPLQEYGLPHHYDARTEAEWGYGSLIGDRDINEHDFNWHVYWTPTICGMHGVEPAVSAARLAEIVGKKTPPYNDPMMVDYSDDGVFSDAMAKTVAWHRHYTRFWKQSMLYCDWAWADFVNPYGPDYEGITPEGEPKFLNAVTGGDMTFEDGMEVGRRIWNLDRAIWVLQGRHRDVEVFAEYNYTTGAAPGTTTYESPYTMPVYEDGEWSYKSVAGRVLDRARFEEWKTKYYALEGWDTQTGWPTRASLEELDLAHVADALEAADRLGAA
jgi:aldehyde:ferredoxin oxidoreductase